MGKSSKAPKAAKQSFVRPTAVVLAIATCVGCAAPKGSTRLVVPRLPEPSPQYSNFKGDRTLNRPSHIFEALNHEKDEFESSATFTARREGLITSALASAEGGSWKLATPIPTGSLFEDVEVQYDADQGMLIVEVNFSGQTRWYSSEQNCVEVERTTRDGGNYLGSNAYGTTVPVSVERQTKYNLVFSNYGEYGIDLEDGTVTFCLPMDPKAAALAKGHLRILFEFVPVQPYTYNSSEHKAGTLDDPQEVYLVKRFVHANVRRIIFYDAKTNRVHGVLEADPVGKPGKPPA